MCRKIRAKEMFDRLYLDWVFWLVVVKIKKWLTGLYLQRPCAIINVLHPSINIRNPFITMTEHQDTPRLHTYTTQDSNSYPKMSVQNLQGALMTNWDEEKLINCLQFKVASEAIWSRPARKSYSQSHRLGKMSKALLKILFLFLRWDMLDPRWGVLDPC